jgi:hypothetical protein
MRRTIDLVGHVISSPPMYFFKELNLVIVVGNADHFAEHLIKRLDELLLKPDSSPFLGIIIIFDDLFKLYELGIAVNE